MPPPSLTLYTFSMSHFSEKIRWTLDASGLAFHEVVLTPSLHQIPALCIGGQGSTTLPILQVNQPDGTVDHVQDSTEILHWLDQHLGPLPVMPRNIALNEDTMGIEERFDAIGEDVARYLYSTALDQNERVIEMWTRHASRRQARLVKWLFPISRWVFKRRLGITPEGAAQSALRIQQAMAWLDGRLSDGRQYLVGHQFSVADIAAASILAPLACPAEHAVYGATSFRREPAHSPVWLANRPCMAWVRTIYRLHRDAGLAGESVAAA